MDIRQPDGSAGVSDRPRRRSRLHAATTAVGTACVLGTASAAGAGGVMQAAAHASTALAANSGPAARTNRPGSIRRLAELAPPASRPVATAGPSHATSGGS